MQIHFQPPQRKSTFDYSLVTSSSPGSGFRNRIMAALHRKAQSTIGKKSVEDEAEEVRQLIEKCLQLYMDREEIAAGLEDAFGFNPNFTREVWANLEKNNPEFFQNYHARLVLKQQIIRFNELLEQQYRAMNFPVVPDVDDDDDHARLVLKQQIIRFNELLKQQYRAMNFPVVPAEQQTSMELAETAPQADSLVSETSNMNEAESSKPPANPVRFSGSEEVTGPDPNPMLGRSFEWSRLGGQGMMRNTALDAAHMPISQVSNLIAGGNPPANFREPVQSLPVMSRAESSKPPANSVGFSGSEEVMGPDPNPMLGRSLDWSWLGGQGMRRNTALDAAHMPISQVSNLITGGNRTANFREPVQSSPVMARSLSQSDPNPQASDQKDHANFASGQGSQFAYHCD